ncbi:leucine-rich repeat-containing protein DDB G0290503, putative [Babesia caballi]|uniref:Leucine-rich repeat-containing protein DDB G0290503, putative n=1 Tax=Babesia caballi TaxID=5871 RepID=A0AAV4LYP4_BABCB|nr:leucine-rich repeat-containing protein DDB G0290503, putative [Babesia caballi]
MPVCTFGERAAVGSGARGPRYVREVDAGGVELEHELEELGNRDRDAAPVRQARCLQNAHAVVLSRVT